MNIKCIQYYVIAHNDIRRPDLKKVIMIAFIILSIVKSHGKVGATAPMC